jgi:hypothetical protein
MALASVDDSHRRGRGNCVNRTPPQANDELISRHSDGLSERVRIRVGYHC